MRFNKRSRPPPLTMDMTPMIDVVFQLIIFFMTVSQQSKLTVADLELPKMPGSHEQVETTLILNVMMDGHYEVNGEKMPLAKVKAYIKQELDGKGGDANLLKVVLRVDRRGTSAATNELMLMLRQAGIKQTRIAVESPGRQ